MTTAAADQAGPPKFYVVEDNPARQAINETPDPSSRQALAQIADRSTAIWLGEWNASNQTVVAHYEADAAAAGQIPVFVLYAIPHRDCGSFSGGGYTTAADYEHFVDEVHAGIDGRRTVVIVEPDALPMMTSCLNAGEQAERISLIRYASQVLSRPGTSVYLDAGNWQPPSYIAGVLAEAGIVGDDGFSLNVSGTEATKQSQSYGDQIVADLRAKGIGGKHDVIDTSRNGNGSAGNPANDWCNPRGLALGTAPTTETSDPVVDAYLWVKYPGESDGSCTGDGVYDPSAPPSGTFWPAYAIHLAEGHS